MNTADRAQQLDSAGRPKRRAGPSAGYPWLLGTVLALSYASILLCILTISFLSNDVQRKVDSLAVANADTTIWSLAQIEVELLALEVAVRQAQVSEQPNLREVRRRYDIFYSRVRLIHHSRQLTNLRNDETANTAIAELTEFLDWHTAAVDGPDDALLAGLPAMVEDIELLRPKVRAFSLLGVRLNAEASDTKRNSIATTLTRIGYLTMALVFALLLGISILVALFWRSTRAERSAAEAGSRLEKVIAASLDGIITADVNGRIIEYNGAAEEVFGYSRAEAIGSDFTELIVPEAMRANHALGMERYRLTGKQQMVGMGLVRLEAQRKNGTIFPVEMSLSTAVSGGKEILVAFVRDISGRVAAEQELIFSRDSAVAGEQAKAELLAVMSHEMRTPLNGIMGTVELLEETRLSRGQMRLVSALKTSADLLQHHVNGVLSISRAEAGQLDLQHDEVNPSALLIELVESQRHTIEANGNIIRCETSAAPERIWVDPLRLRQVILNLVGNANKFTRNGEILVDCDLLADGNWVEFRVIDSGIGIAEENLDRIFEEFQTLDSSYSRQAEGTGLGLAISRRLVHAMGGEIGVDSEPEEGSLFWVRLPVGAPALKQAAVRSQKAARAGSSSNPVPEMPSEPLEVLLVEDNPINRLVAGEMLQSAGHTVVEAHNGREGIRLAADRKFDVILMDISMPEVDGIRATGLIREGNGPNRQTPIIALTAHALPEDADRFLAAGITETLIKPLTMAALDRALAMARSCIDSPLQPASAPDMNAVISELRDQLGASRVDQMLTTFRSEAENLLQSFDTAEWETETPARRADAVHKVAGSAAILGAGQFRLSLQAIEKDYRAGEIADAKKRLTEAKEIWARTSSALVA